MSKTWTRIKNQANLQNCVNMCGNLKKKILTTKWKILAKVPTFNPIKKKCIVCLKEKFFIIFHNSGSSLNKRRAIFNSCVHRKHKLLENFKSWTIISFRSGNYLICIWLILARRSPPLEICRWFPQIVFILLNRVRPINVGFSNRFFCSSDKRFLIIIIKKKFEEDKS